MPAEAVGTALRASRSARTTESLDGVLVQKLLAAMAGNTSVPESQWGLGRSEAPNVQPYEGDRTTDFGLVRVKFTVFLSPSRFP